MKHDLVIRNGTVIDGTGGERYEADVAISDGHISLIGNVSGVGKEEIDASNQVVAPGFIDGHTHLDAQAFWEPLGSSSCYQGVTTAVHGNCGFTLAPIQPDFTDIVLEHFEAAEALPLEALKAGIDIQWQSFAEYFEVVKTLPKGINYAGYVGHSALRIFAMGERAFSPKATDDDMICMLDGLEDALAAGAIGFSTSRVSHQRLRDGRLISSGHAEWAEVCTLVKTMGKRGVFELAREKFDPLNPDAYDFPERLQQLAIDSGATTMLGVFHAVDESGAAARYMDMIDKTVAGGGRMVAQVSPNTMYEYYSFLARVPFSSLPAWQDLQGLSARVCLEKLREQSVRQRLLKALESSPATLSAHQTMQWVEHFTEPNETLRDLALKRQCTLGEVVIDLAIESDLNALWRLPFANVDDEQTLALLNHPNAVPTFSDAGAHVSEVSDFGLPAMLIHNWVRQQPAFSLEQAVHLVTGKMADTWGFHDRGRLQCDKAADVVIFDPQTIAPSMPKVVHDFPEGMARIAQGCDGISATIVNGEVFLRNGEHTGALRGKLLTT